MSPCCGGNDGATNECARTPTPASDEITGADDACCTGTECECNDTCVNELAKVICLSDDEALHKADEKLVLGQNVTTSSASCSGTCECEDSRAIPQLTSTTQASSSIPSPACGLRKRKGANDGANVPAQACGEHKALARERQQATLSAFGCICKALLARGFQSCCSTRPSATVAASLKSLRTSVRSKVAPASCCGDKACARERPRPPSRLSVDSCCRDNSCDKRSDLSIRTVSRASRASVDSCCAGGRCSKGDVADIPSLRQSQASLHSCCAGGGCTKSSPPYFSRHGSRASLKSCGAASCCGKEEPDEYIDVEKRASLPYTVSGTNRCVLAVKGMTCVGCENKLISALKAQDAISNIKTSLVLCRAEFDYSCDPADLPLLIQALEKRTGFTTEQIASPSSARALEITTQLLEKMISLPPPAGVFKVVKIRKATLRITYDPHVVGAREAMAAYDECSPVLAPEPQDPALTAGAKHIQMLLLRTAASSILTVPVLVMTWAPLPHHPHAYAISSLVLATIVQTAVAGPFYRHAFKSLFLSGLIEMDLLVVLSTTTAYVYSVVAFAYEMLGKPLQGGSFFETSTLLVTLIMFGQLASAFARQRAVAAISLRSLQESSAVVTVDHADGSVTDEIIDARLLQHNDIFRVLPDSTIITDGVVVSGSSTVDESMMTGESLPVEKTSGSEVVAGTRNGSGMLLVRVKRLPGENTISDIANMVDDARFSRAHIQGLVDRVCAWFVPTVLVLGAIVFIIWVLIGIYGKKQSAGDAVVRAVTYAIAVLAISCPCAIGLAVPMVVLIASGVAARLGLIFKAATTIETAREVTHAVFDKTGTLTTGHLEVAHVEILQETVGDGSLKSSSVILALVAVSKHPVARAVAACLIKDGGTTSAQLANIEEIAGKGVQGNLSGRLLQAGNAKWLDLEGHPSVRQVLDAQLTTFCVTYNGTLVAVFGLSDSIRPEVPGLLSMLSKRNIEVSVLSGDHASVVQRVASTLRIPPNRVRASCLPADKAEYIRTLQVGGARVLFCGDGLNDSVALAQADIGVHVAVSAGAGAAASAAADVVLIHTSLDGVAALLGLSDAVHRRIMLNFAWAAVYNTVAILFAAGAFVHARIAPAYAGLGELVSVLPVVLVAMQLKWYAA